jgi:poly-gamma-glutamate synthesis protein (capsule biosynthesis protein)
MTALAWRPWLRAIAATFLCVGIGACPRDEVSTTLLFGGDVMLGRHVERAARARHDWGFPFRRVAPRMQAATVAFANLECIAASAGGPSTFKADPQALDGLREAGLDVVSVANNHTMDAGPEALAEMLGRLEALGITPTGARYLPEPQKPATIEANGLRVGYLAYSWSTGDYPPVAGLPSLASTRREEIVADIERARPHVDYLVVSLHMGVEGARLPGEGQRQKARAAIDAGADLVVGHHPHVPQEIERYGRGFIAYSLGDLVFDHPQLSVDGALLEVTLEGGRPVRLVWMRTRINPELQPEVIGETVWAREALSGPNASLN